MKKPGIDLLSTWSWMISRIMTETIVRQVLESSTEWECLSNHQVTATRASREPLIFRAKEGGMCGSGCVEPRGEKERPC